MECLQGVGPGLRAEQILLVAKVNLRRFGLPIENHSFEEEEQSFNAFAHMVYDSNF